MHFIKQEIISNFYKDIFKIQPSIHYFIFLCILIEHLYVVHKQNICITFYISAEQPPACHPTLSGWSVCSSTCGVGLSTRTSNLNDHCKPQTEIRLCQNRRCDDMPSMYYQQRRHLRVGFFNNNLLFCIMFMYKSFSFFQRGHECKATHRIGTAVYLQFGPCKSKKLFRPKYCGLCTVSNIKCEPVLSTTINVEFICNGPHDTEKVSDLLQEYVEAGLDMWELNKSIEENPDSKLLTLPVQWILKCRCEYVPSVSTSKSGEVILHRVHRTSFA